jgi:hypothetical protein
MQSSAPGLLPVVTGMETVLLIAGVVLICLGALVRRLKIRRPAAGWLGFRARARKSSPGELAVAAAVAVAATLAYQWIWVQLTASLTEPPPVVASPGPARAEAPLQRVSGRPDTRAVETLDVADGRTLTRPPRRPRPAGSPPNVKVAPAVQPAPSFRSARSESP